MRSDRVQASDPDTPHPASDVPVQPQADDGVLLDLEGLGLEDSVVPPSKLTKLEKIGSGGFKEWVLPDFPSEDTTNSWRPVQCLRGETGREEGRHC